MSQHVHRPSECREVKCQLLNLANCSSCCEEFSSQGKPCTQPGDRKRSSLMWGEIRRTERPAGLKCMSTLKIASLLITAEVTVEGYGAGIEQAEMKI